MGERYRSVDAELSAWGSPGMRDILHTWPWGNFANRRCLTVHYHLSPAWDLGVSRGGQRVKKPWAWNSKKGS